jgi:hypothetical protein
MSICFCQLQSLADSIPFQLAYQCHLWPHQTTQGTFFPPHPEGDHVQDWDLAMEHPKSVCLICDLLRLGDELDACPLQDDHDGGTYLLRQLLMNDSMEFS